MQKIVFSARLALNTQKKGFSMQKKGFNAMNV
jgi:hypothetical protein